MVNRSATVPGILYIVATPIGNRDDISLRAISVLKEVDSILAEDTRHSAQLLTMLGIKKQLISLHAHNEQDKSQQIIDDINQGKSFALISDAGTPLISDPGFPLVRLAHQHQINVVPIPGACALITALCASGLACDSFTFAGFLPAKQTARLARLALLKSSENTLIFYESTHRIIDCIDDIMSVYGESFEFVIAKELTKAFERFIQGTGQEIKNWLLADPGHPKGEFVVLLPPVPVESTQTEDKKLLSVLLAELPLKQAVKIASALSNTNKNDLYKMALDLSK